MITYVAINLSNRRFYVGSTSKSFQERWTEHLSSSANYPFQNSLRKNPENFFVFYTEDDGLTTRQEEQSYLDFYHGSEQCYNLARDTCSPFAGRKHSEKTKKLIGENNNWTGESHKKRKETWEKRGGHPSQGKPGCWRGKKRPDHSERMKGENNPSFGLQRFGEDNPAFGKKHWVNREGEKKFQAESPGEGWINGRKWKDPE